MNIFKKLELKMRLKKIHKKDEELNNAIDIGLTYIMIKCKVLIAEGSVADDELKEMVKTVGSIILEKEEIENELKEKGFIK